MKKTIITFVTLLISVGLMAQEETEKQTEQATPEPVQLTSQADTLNYAVGAFIGQWMQKNGFAITNANIFLRGMSDVLQNRELAVVDSTIAPIVSAYQLSTQNERNRQMEAQLFEALKGKAGVGVLPDGVHYIVAEKGTGARPTLQDTVVINAVGVFPDGTVFEDTYQKGQPLTMPVSNLIPGLKEVIQMMPEEAVWRVFVPSQLGYGPQGFPNKIPPYSALIFDIKLMEVKKAN